MELEHLVIGNLLATLGGGFTVALLFERRISKLETILEYYFKNKFKAVKNEDA